MNNSNMIKKDLLRRKINEYFTKHPKARSVIINANIGEDRTTWKVKREGKSFNIVEVNTKRQQFVFEAGEKTVGGKEKGKKPHEYDPEQKPGFGTAAPSGFKPDTPKGGTLAPGEFGKGSPQAVQQAASTIRQQRPDIDYGPAMSPQQTMGLWDPDNAQGQFATTVKQVGFKQALSRMPEKELQKYFGISRAHLKTGQIDTARAAQLGMKIVQGETKIKEQQPLGGPKLTAPNVMRGQQPQKTYDQRLGDLEKGVDFNYSNVLGVFTDPKTTGSSANLTKLGNAISRHMPKISDKGEKDNIGTLAGHITNFRDQRAHLADHNLKEADGDREPSGYDSSGAGIETAADETPPEQQQEPMVKKTPEEEVLSKSLAGQTIKEASVELSQKGGSLNLDLTSIKADVKLEWENSGKVVFHFKGQPFVLRHS